MQFNITFKTIFEYILKKLVLCIQMRFVSTEKTTRIASRASCYTFITGTCKYQLPMLLNDLNSNDTNNPLHSSVVACQRYFFGSCMPAIFMSLCNSHDYERLSFQKSIIENCFIESYV